ncbi:MAG TPA: hypothetical protein VJ801_17995 [Polyangia bacterium]|jgi:hypothetical protein|nr:hypothetical protein [Polyangia bacterium]
MAGLETLFLRSLADAPKLRIVAVADSLHLGRPEAAALQHIERSNFATLVAVVLPGPRDRANPSRPEGRGSALAPLHQLAFRLLEAWDRRAFPDVHALIVPVDCSDVFARVPNLSAERADRSGALAFPADTLAALRGLKPDVILHCAPGPVPDVLCALAGFGVWSIHLGEPNEPRSSTPCFREVRDGRLLSSVALLAHGGPSGGVHVLAQAQVATEHSLFRSKNCVRPTLTALTFVIRKLHELHQRGWDQFAQGLVAVPPATDEGAQGRDIPDNREIVKFLAPRIGRRAVNLVRRPASSAHWQIALRSGFAQRLVEDPSSEGLAAFHWIPSPPGGYFADPFLLRRQGRLWLFCEEMSFAEGKGALSCMEVLPDGRLSESVRVLSRPYHLSYPVVFEAEGEVFMIPETMQSGCVELYRAADFPHAWVKVRDLLPIRAVDSTPFVFEGRIWLFVTAIDPDEASYQLLLFHSDRLDGDWTMHPSSPLSLDIRNARSAGAIFPHNGKLYRPSQDCAPYYGHKLNFHEITRLDIRGYEERLVRTIGPSAWPGLRGVHSYAVCGDVEAIDGKK